jgi:hypothetical protein
MHYTDVLYYGRFVLVAVIAPAIALLGWSQFKAAHRRFSYFWIPDCAQTRRFNPVVLIYLGAGIIIFWGLLAVLWVVPTITRLSGGQFAGVRTLLLGIVALLFVVGIAEMATGFVLWRRQKSVGPK